MTLEEYFLSSASFLPLFTLGQPIIFSRRGSTIPHVFRSGSINGEIPLYTSGNYSAGEVLKLFVSGAAGFPAYSSLDLLCYNDTPTATLNLFTIGEGVNDGYTPSTSTLMLYIKCAYGAELPLYVHGGPQPSVNDSLNLYALGGSEVVDQLNLVIPNVSDVIYDSLNLYTHGF
jgi:hypothetical protein